MLSLQPKYLTEILFNVIATYEYRSLQIGYVPTNGIIIHVLCGLVFLIESKFISVQWGERCFWNPKIKIDDSPIICFKQYDILSPLFYRRTMTSGHKDPKG